MSTSTTAYERRLRRAREAELRWAPPSWSDEEVVIVQLGGKGLDSRETAEFLGITVHMVRKAWAVLLDRELEREGKAGLMWRFLPPLCPFERARLSEGLRHVSPRQYTLLCLLAAGWGGHAAGACAGFASSSETGLAGELAWEALGLGRWASWKPQVMLRGVEWDERLLLLRETRQTDDEPAWRRAGLSLVHQGMASRSVGDARLRQQEGRG